MIVYVVAALLAGSGAGADLRHEFVECLKGVSTQAKTQKVGVEAFIDFARTNCANSEAPFKASLVNADVTHGMSRKESVSDAASQLNDYYSEWLDNYKADVGTTAPAKGAAAPGSAPPPASTAPASQPQKH